MEKCYNVMFTGRVQDVGLRSLIEDIAKHLDLKGFVFNDIDGSIKMVCCGDSSEIGNFLKEIQIRGGQKGALIKDIKKEEIPVHIYLPQRFIRLYTDELADISRKLDVGIEILKDIKSDTSALNDIKSDTSAIKDVLTSFVLDQREHNKRMDEHTKRMDEHNKRMDEHTKRMDEHNLRLEKILEKLAENRRKED